MKAGWKTSEFWLSTAALLLWATSSCRHHCPPCASPRPQTVLSRNPDCRLPDLPAPLGPAVGFPAPDGQSIYVSKTDWAQLVTRDVGLRDWIAAAAACLAVRP